MDDSLFVEVDQFLSEFNNNVELSARELFDTGWPWPLDAVQQWFESFWNSILGWVNWAVQELKDTIWPWIRGAMDFIWDKIQWVKSCLDSLGSQINLWLISARDTITSTLGGTLNWISSAVQGAWDFLRSLWDQISSTVWNTITNVGQQIYEHIKGLWDFLQGVGQQIWGGIQWVGNVINEIGQQTWQTIVNAVTQVDDIVGRWYHENVAPKIDEAKKDIITAFDGAKDAIASKLGEAWDNFTSWIYNGLKSVWDWLVNAAGTVAQTLIGVINTARAALEEMIRPWFTDWANSLQTALKPHSPSPEVAQLTQTVYSTYFNYIHETLDKYAHSPMTDEAAVGAATALGVGALIADLMLGVGALAIDLPHPFKDVKAVELWKKLSSNLGVQIIASAPFVIPVEVALFPVLRRFYNRQFRPNIPGVGDMVRFVVRDVWNPAVQTPAPEEFKKWMGELGYDDFWATAYWTAHWEIPNYSQAREMWWRGKIDDKEFLDMVHLADYHPGFDKYWIELSQELPGRIDARWMTKWGIIGEDELKKLLRSSGLHIDWLDKVADAYLKEEYWPFINSIITELKKKRREGYMTADEFKAEVKKYIPNDKIVDLIAQATELEADYDYLQERENVIKNAFLKDQIDEAALESELREFIKDGRRLTQKIELFKYQRLPKPKAGKAAK